MKTKMYKFRIAIIFTLANLLIVSSTFAQAPQKMSYQAVIRNASNALVTSTPVGMQISILQGSSTGTAVYVETQTPSSNANGLVSLEIGTGTPLTGTFAVINWATGPYFIKIETDPTGGTAYTIAGTTELMSVPYALHAKTAEGITGGGSTDNFYLGQDTLGGIVYYIYKDATGTQHGLIVSKTQSTAVWQAVGVLVNANRTWDGAFNTLLMTSSAAATYIATLGAGWYLPSIDELSLLWQSRFTSNKSLNAGGFTLLSTTANYWSSTEYFATDAFYFYFGNGNATNYGKTGILSVRGVRAF